MRMGTMASLLGIIALVAACGGSASHPDDVAKPGPCPECSDPDSDEDYGDDVLIPEEKYQEINHIFERKTSQVGRCHVEGVEAGQIQKSQKGGVTIGLTIMPDGSLMNVRIMETDFGSPALEQCVLDLIKGADFPELPKSLETSHTYVLDRL